MEHESCHLPTLWAFHWSTGFSPVIIPEPSLSNTLNASVICRAKKSKSLTDLRRASARSDQAELTFPSKSIFGLSSIFFMNAFTAARSCGKWQQVSENSPQKEFWRPGGRRSVIVALPAHWASAALVARLGGRVGGRKNLGRVAGILELSLSWVVPTRAHHGAKIRERNRTCQSTCRQPRKKRTREARAGAAS